MSNLKTVYVSKELYERLRHAAADLDETVKWVVEVGMDYWLKTLGEPDRTGKIQKEVVDDLRS